MEPSGQRIPLKKSSPDKADEGGSSNEDLSARSRLLITILCFFAVTAGLYLWGADNAATDIETSDITVVKSENETSLSFEPPTTPSAPIVAPIVAPIATPDASEGGSTPATNVDPNDASDPVDEPVVSETQSTSSGGGVSDQSCTDVCSKREANRKEKYGGDLLNFQDLHTLAEAAHKKLQGELRKDYGEYFDKMFVNGTKPDGGTSYYGGMVPGTNGTSRERMKRKMKIKVLKMMASVKATESNVNGCDCVEKTGSVNGGVDDDILYSVPEFYEKYVFANGGHSNSAGHGNMYSEAYTAVFGRDVRPIWEAIGIEMIDRNYGMGAMRANPYISGCIKEVMGLDVDFLAWNYGMTDGKAESAMHYVFRGALIPSRPAFVFVDWRNNGRKLCDKFEPLGLAMFNSARDGHPVKQIPDTAPDGIPLPTAQIQKFPPMAQYVKCNGRLEGKDLCFHNKWSCNQNALEKGIKCICPNVGKRSGWHMGYRMHALEGHLMALPFIEMLLEALKELADASPTDTEQLMTDLQKGEDEDFKLFTESSLVGLGLEEVKGYYDGLGEPTSELFETWFKGNSICHIALLPSQTRFLGISTNSNKTGDVAIYSHETYELGEYIADFNFKKDDPPYDFVDPENATNHQEGKFSIISRVGERSGSRDIEAWERACPAIVMPDYKDHFIGSFLDRKISITLPNEKEKEYYGYDPKKFKGLIAFTIPLYSNSPCKKGCHSYDFLFEDIEARNLTITVNSQPVQKIIRTTDKCAILVGKGNNPFFEPDPKTGDYTLEFTKAKNADYAVRIFNFILM